MMSAWEGDSAALGKYSVIADAKRENSNLAAMLDMLKKTGGLPDDADIAAGTSAASKLFAPQREQLKNRFTDQGVEYARKAASMGRDVLDPILQAKMRTEQTRQEGEL